MILSFPDYLLLFVGVFNFILGGFIIVNNPRNKVNIMFAVYAAFLTLWALFLFIFRNSSLDLAPFFMRAIYASGLSIALALWYFIKFFPRPSTYRYLYRWPVLFFGSTVIAAMFVPGLIVKEIMVLPDGTRSTVLNSAGYWLFFAVFFLFYCGGLFLFIKHLKETDQLLRKQASFILIGVTIAVIFGGYFNIILPSPFIQNYHYIHWGPFFTLVLVALVAYAVARYQFMNIKALLTELYVITLVLIFSFSIFFPVLLSSIIFRISLLVGVLISSYLLVRSILQEIQRREEVAAIATSLQEANTRLEQLDHQKTEFLSIAAHQLRTPLSVLNGYLGLLQEGGYGLPPTEMLEVFRNMDQNNSRLVKLVDEFLNITHIEQGRAKFNYTSCNLTDIVTSVVKELKEHAEQKNLSLQWKGAAVPYMLNIDSDKIRHAVFNFVDNAIKYSEHGVISINLEPIDDGVTFTVRDQGIGFEETDRVNFFNKFYRGENVQGTNVNGTGLGLYVVSKFISAHGGRVWAKSGGLGKGSEFGFWVPTEQKQKKGE